MALYGGIDLHSNNNVVVVQDEEDRVVAKRRLPNDLKTVLAFLEPYRKGLVGIVVESTYNWYWLVDGLMAAGYGVHLANTVAIQQYDGLKYRDDGSDARWLAKLLRLGELPEGHIYPRRERGIRDLLRKRSQLVRQSTMNLLSIQNLYARSRGEGICGNRVKELTADVVDAAFEDPNVALAVKSSVKVMDCLAEQIVLLEQAVHGQVRLRRGYKRLLTVPGIGKILALTIMLETGDIGRFHEVGNYVSYARLVGSSHLTNGKRKGSGNTKNGNAFLCWAFIEAANFAIRHNEAIRRYYQRKLARTKRIVALKAVAHKLARACYHMIQEDVAFDLMRAFG
ncbi:MAG TPA: IS110 family transposase [Candidatus Hydrogenedentes bacterium]|mgnify:FL=1|nr:IS110 family transposase [Candidatus Hydrogenedentota bacterium]